MPISNTAELHKKLNFKDTKKAYILHAPKGYKLAKVKSLSAVKNLSENALWIQAFYVSESSLTHELPAIKEKLKKEGILWLCWPKRSASKGGDLSDSVVRSLGLACGLVDTKVVSINETWSGLKFVYRLKDR